MAGEALNWPWIYLWPRLLQYERQLARVERGEVVNVTLVMIAPTRKAARGGEEERGCRLLN